MSPCYSSKSLAYGVIIGGNVTGGSSTFAEVHTSVGVRPVVSLKSCVKYASGDGSASNPYTIEETASGC